MSKIFTAAEVASHNKADNLYITVDGDVYDLTAFQDDHPGELTGFLSSSLDARVHFANMTRKPQVARRSCSA